MPNRRQVLTLGAAIVAFDALGVGWVTQAQADTGAAGLPVPRLDGDLVTDVAALTEAADDYGQIAHRRPRAVLRPGSVSDVVKVVRFAAEHRIPVAVRGQGHSTFGQAQAPGGVVIDSRTLATVHRVSARGVVVDAGATWLEVTKAALAAGFTPPVATDYLGLSVGGTLSVGGIGGATSRHGLLVDTVRELEVVTGEGKVVRCSSTVERDLFEAVLGGLGQYAVIVRATLDLVPAPTTARIYHLSYPDLRSMTAAQRIALADGRFDYLEGQVVWSGTGWTYLLEGGVYHSAKAPDDKAVVRGLPIAAKTEITGMPYFEWLNRVYAVVEQLRPLRFPNPWLNLFLPDRATDSYIENLLAELTPADTGGGPILLYPFTRKRLTRPMVSVPDSPVVFILSILRVVAPPDEAVVRKLLVDNRSAYDKALAVGGTQYPIGSIPSQPGDWQRHYGSAHGRVRRLKNRFDPRGILAPEQGIF
ncbi:FAD-binding protein [Actinokineospora cianjurensis]|uniref:FAD/FMN-containing dehydrogenase n=1 Tax=Actinokineospora cianjurensis TaxID=585224 RepID=A0A421B068_9PSEU|nr:FAD-binding protein [Actinokineospora cianjurensis]RLK55502.1 FAD/FMN-containing dehydrogenase [Actinokineospora cianjurensis]